MDEKHMQIMEELQAYLTDEQTAIIEALAKIDRGGERVLFVQRDGKLVASLTDGDVRRFILARGNLQAAVREAANYRPKSLTLAQRGMARAFMQKHDIDGVPLLDDDGYIADIVLWREMTGTARRKPPLHAPVVMMAGGKGTRLYPYTKILPKPLIPIGEIPISEHIINGFHEAGCRDFFIIVNYKKNMLKAYFNELDKDYNIYFIDEEKPLGTGGGLSLLKGRIDKTFFLTNCDILIQESFERIFRFHKEQGNLITMVCSLKNFQIPYGVVNLAEDGQVASMTEKPHIPFLTNTGCYVVEPDVVESLPKDTPMGFPNIMLNCRQAGGKVGVFPIGEDAWMDMGVPEEMDRMRMRLGV